MLTITFARSYKKAPKNPGERARVVFVYNVHGSEAELKQFETAQGEHLRKDDEDKPIFHTTRFVGDRSGLLITKNNHVIPDTTEFDKAESMVNQYGGNLGDALAQQLARKLTGYNAPQVEPEGDK